MGPAEREWPSLSYSKGGVNQVPQIGGVGLFEIPFTLLGGVVAFFEKTLRLAKKKSNESKSRDFPKNKERLNPIPHRSRNERADKPSLPALLLPQPLIIFP